MKKKVIAILLCVAIMSLMIASASADTAISPYWSIAFEEQSKDGSHDELQTMVLQRVIYEYVRYYDMNNNFVDGIFGSNTKKKVRLFQRLEGIDDDGVVGPVTWGRLQAKVGLGNTVYDSVYGTLYGYYVCKYRQHVDTGYAAEANLNFPSATYFGTNGAGKWYTRLRTDYSMQSIN